MYVGFLNWGSIRGDPHPSPTHLVRTAIRPHDVTGVSGKGTVTVHQRDSPKIHIEK